MKMPDLSTTGAEVKVTKWLVEIGQPVRRGQPLLEIETDKATMEVESVATGTVKAVRAQPGDQVAAGQVIVVIEAEGRAGGEADSAAAETARTPAGAEQPAMQLATPPSGQKAKPGSLFARNRRRSQEGAGGQPLPTSVAQRTVARRMQESKRTIPHFYLHTSANAEPMMARREAARPNRLVWDAFFVYAAGRSLQRFERMCCRFEDDRLVPQGTDAVGVAIEVEGDLFVTPVAGPGSKSPEQISDEIAAAAGRLQSGDAEAKRIRPACLTVTNLGASGVESFAAIVTPPESCVLAIGRVAPAAVAENGTVGIQNRVSLTLSVDHRVVNGRYAADFLGDIVQELEGL